MTRVRVARSGEEAEAFRPAWEALGNEHNTSDLDFVLTYCRHAPDVVRPHMVLVEEDGAPAGLAVCRLEDVRLTAKLGYRVVYEPLVRALTVVYGGLLGAGDEAAATRVLGALARSVEDEGLDVLRLRMLEVGSPGHRAATSAGPALRLQRFPPRVTHRRASLPGSLDEFLAHRSRRRRETVRRYVRRLERTYGDEARVEIFRKRAGLERLLADTASIHRETYQAVLGVGFSDATVQRRLLELAVDRGWFRGYVLYLRDRPVAFWHGNLYRGSFGISATGFDPAFADDRPGTYLLMKLVEDLCADEAAHTLDFGLGDADYKRHFGDAQVEEEDVVIVAPKARMVAVNLLQTALLGSTKLARGALARTGGTDALRRRWRARLVKRRAS